MSFPPPRRADSRLDKVLKTVHVAARVFDRLPGSPHFVGEALLNAHLASQERQRPRASAGLAAEQVMSWDEVSARLQDARSAEPAWVDVARIMREWRLGRLTWRIRMMAQLAQRGWSDEDAWNLDHVLCTRLAAQLDSLADQLHGWPSTDEFPTPEDWEQALRATAADLRRVYGSAATHQAADQWMESPAGAEESSRYERWAALDTADAEAVTRALRWVADHHQHLWD